MNKRIPAHTFYAYYAVYAIQMFVVEVVSRVLHEWFA